MRRHPTHYTGQTRSIQQPVTINGRYNPYELDHEYAFLVCTCGYDVFEIWVSGYPEVQVRCTNCNCAHLVYDVSQYPAATGYDPDKGKLKLWKSKDGKHQFQAIAGWLYPEEPEDEEDDNDLDWFVLVAKEPSSETYIEIVNDETA